VYFERISNILCCLDLWHGSPTVVLADHLPGHNAYGSNQNIDFIYTSEGTVFKTGNAYMYHYNLDHIGNVRVTMRKVGSQAEVLQKDGYSFLVYFKVFMSSFRSVIILLGGSVAYLEEVLKISIFIMGKRIRLRIMSFNRTFS